MCLLRINLPNLCPNMIHVDALDFSEWHPEEVISFFWRSVYYNNYFSLFTCCVNVLKPLSWGLKMIPDSEPLLNYPLKCHEYRVYTFPQLAGQTRLSGQTRLVDYRAPRLHCPSSRIRLASLLAHAGQIWPIPIMLREYSGASSFICHAFPRASLSALLSAL